MPLVLLQSRVGLEGPGIIAFFFFKVFTRDDERSQPIEMLLFKQAGSVSVSRIRR